MVGLAALLVVVLLLAALMNNDDGYLTREQRRKYMRARRKGKGDREAMREATGSKYRW